jgi:nicotinamidase/pyrazinamidase
MHLLIIDPQNDFCDLPEAYWPVRGSDGTRVAPALPVPGAHADMLRLAQLIRRAGDGLCDITITLDGHHRLDIAHPTFWQTGTGESVRPFTQIVADDVRSGRFVPRLPGEARERAIAYLDALESRERYRHMIWPVHCEIGSWGHGVHEELLGAYNLWEDRTLRSVRKVIKGGNPWTEHYSALQAEVPDPTDSSTSLNVALVSKLRQADRIFIAGEAGSHCVKATTEHLVAELQPGELGKLVLVTDCMSPVAGFEGAYRDFLMQMQARGLRVAEASQVEEELLLNGKG